MKITSNGHTCRLACGTDARAGESWATHFARLRRHVAAVREATDATDGGGAEGGERGRDAVFALRLRLTPETLAGLEDDESVDRFRAWLDAERCRVTTIDPAYGAPADRPRPVDRRSPAGSGPAGLDLGARLATLLARLGPPDAHGSIGLPPDAFDTRKTSGREASTDGLHRSLAHCVALERATGVCVALALRPGPGSALADADALVRFVERELLSNAGIRTLAALTGLAASGARQALHRHLGVCHDVRRSAVEFESPLEALDRYAASGIEVLKLELGSALHVSRVNEAALRRLQRFDEPRRPCRVVERRGEHRIGFDALAPAIGAARYRLERRSALTPNLALPLAAAAPLAALPSAEPPAEWRVDLPVALFLERANLFSTTRDSLEEVLAAQRERGLARRLELGDHGRETLPSELRERPAAEAIARELDWVRRRL